MVIANPYRQHFLIAAILFNMAHAILSVSLLWNIFNNCDQLSITILLDFEHLWCCRPITEWQIRLSVGQLQSATTAAQLLTTSNDVHCQFWECDRCS